MKNYLLMLTGFVLLLSSCATQASYFGDKFAATNSIDIFYSAHDVKKEYKVIGHLNCTNDGQEIVKKILVAKAKEIGADAIVITGNTVDTGGKYGSDVVNADALKYQ